MKRIAPAIVLLLVSFRLFAAVTLLTVGSWAQRVTGPLNTQVGTQTTTVAGTQTTTVTGTQNTNVKGTQEMNGTQNVNAGVRISEPNQAPAVFASVPPPSAPCIVGIGGGGSGPLGGLTLGFGKKDKDCAKRELARLLLAAGQRQGAVNALCATEAARGIPDCGKLEIVAPEPAERKEVASQPVSQPQIVVPAPQVTVNVPEPHRAFESVSAPTTTAAVPSLKPSIPPQPGDVCVVRYDGAIQCHKPKPGKPCKTGGEK